MRASRARRCRSASQRSSGAPENIVTPVEGDDIFPILHRRLFTRIGAEEDRRRVAEAYADWYESLGDTVPGHYREASYRDRMVTAFPFHPELVDILTNRWGSLGIRHDSRLST